MSCLHDLTSLVCSLREVCFKQDAARVCMRSCLRAATGKCSHIRQLLLLTTQLRCLSIALSAMQISVTLRARQQSGA